MTPGCIEAQLTQMHRHGGLYGHDRASEQRKRDFDLGQASLDA